MEYLEAAVALRAFIKETNNKMLAKTAELMQHPNRMLIKLSKTEVKETMMEAYTNEFVLSTLQSADNTEAFVLTDLAEMEVQGKKLTYILYKGYHAAIEKGLVFFQVIDKQTLEPQGPLQFSNMEDNIFYSIKVSNPEESSCNAMETDKVIKDGKSIVFFIGHMDEKRLEYDIERLIFDTVNNVTKHPRLTFYFILQIAHYGGSPSQELKDEVKKIDAFTQKYIYPEYPNAKFEFEFEEDGTLN